MGWNFNVVWFVFSWWVRTLNSFFKCQLDTCSLSFETYQFILLLFIFAVYFLGFRIFKYSRYFPCVTYNCRRLFSHAHGWFLSFVVQLSLHSMKFFLLTLGITSWATGNIFRKSFQSCLGIPSHPVIFFSSFKCYISVFVFISVQGERWGSSAILLHMDI